jgi:hypothetical protein
VLAVVLVNLVILEVACLAAVHALALASPNRRLDIFLDERLSDLTDGALADFRAGGYDAELGWDNVPNRVVTQANSLGKDWTATYDASGARRSCLLGAALERPVAIATFGDSFTRGDEVGDEETWQCELERRTGLRVANYGVGGYDIAQALFKAERRWREGHVAPVTVLGIYAEDLDRVLNRYRPYFDLSSTGVFGFKPSFRYVDGEIVFLPNPMGDGVTTIADVRALALEVAPTDYWAQQWARVLPEFPYSLQMLRTARYLVETRLGTPHYMVNVWNTDQGREVMLHLLRRFEAGAKQHGTRGVVLLIPETHEWKNGRVPAHYADFLANVLPGEIFDLVIVDIAEAPFDEHRFSVKPFEGHASAYGNRVIAETVLEGLGELPTSSDNGAFSVRELPAQVEP